MSIYSLPNIGALNTNILVVRMQTIPFQFNTQTSWVGSYMSSHAQYHYPLLLKGLSCVSSFSISNYVSFLKSFIVGGVKTPLCGERCVGAILQLFYINTVSKILRFFYNLDLCRHRRKITGGSIMCGLLIVLLIEGSI